MHASLSHASAFRPSAVASKPQQRSIVVVKASKLTSNASSSAAAAAGAASIAASLAALPAFAGELLTFDPANTAAAYAAATSGAAKGAVGAAAAVAAGAAGDASSSVLDALSSVNPLLVAGGAAALAIPAALAAVLGGGGGGKGPGKAKPAPVEAVLESLADEGTVLVDVRSKESAKQFGSPSLPKGAKRAVSLPFTLKVKATKKGEAASYQVDAGFAAKFAKLGLADGDAGVILLDSFGREAPAAAAALAAAGATPEAGIAFVADGAEGPRGWKASGAPWRAPSRGLTFDLSALKNVGGAVDSLADDFKAAPTAAKAGIAVAALVAGATLLFQEASTVLEVAGLVAAGQFAAKRLVFASDRRRTADELRELVDAKIGVAEAGADLRRVADALLEDPVAAAGGAIKAVAESGPSSSSSSPSSRAAAASSPKPAAAAATAAAAAAAAAPAAAAPTPESAAAAVAAGGEGAAEAREWIEKWRAEQAKA